MPWDDSGRRKPDNISDLDEVWRRFYRRLRERLSSAKPPRPPNDSAGGPARGAMNGAIGILSILLAIWFFSGIFIVAPAEQAVVLRFGRYHDTLSAGPHWIPRFIDMKRVVNIGKVESFTYGSAREPVYLLTQDENIVSVSISVWYRITDPRAYLFNVVNPEVSLRQATASALRQVVGQFRLTEVLTTDQSVIRQQVFEQLTQLLDAYHTGLRVTEITMQPAAAPEEVKDKFDDVVRAQEDAQRYINQANAAMASVLPAAEGQASRILQEAMAAKQQSILKAEGDTARFLALLPAYQKAPDIMRQRLYVETIETILSKTSKVLINTTGNNNLISLPLAPWVAETLAKNTTETVSSEKETQSANTPSVNPKAGMSSASSGQRPERPTQRVTRGDTP